MNNILNLKMKYTLHTIAKITKGELIGDDNTVTVIAFDTRSAVGGDALFVALSGARRSGHDFIDAALRAGVRSFLVERIPDNPMSGSYIIVRDTLSALQLLAAHHREQFKGKVVAITGSNGKTIVKEWFAQLWPFQSAGKLFRSPRSYNSQIGVALSLLAIEGDESVAIIEAGISRRGEMERLERMIKPDIGVITNIGEAHGENFSSITEKLDEKLKLFKGCQTVIRGDKLDFETLEKHNLNIVHQIYKALGIEPLESEVIEPVALRLEVQQGLMGSIIINDSYNNDLTSLTVALDFQRRISGASTRTLILSDIEQSSLSSEKLYETVSQQVKRCGLTQFVGVGAVIKSHSRMFDGLAAQFFGSTEELIANLDVAHFAGGSLLIKGSRSFRLERVAHIMEERTHTTTLEVNLSRLVENFNRYRSMVAPTVRTMAMVKASGYGAGGVEVARALQTAGANYLAVAFTDEGVTLRRAGITMPIVVLNSDPGSFAIMVAKGLEPEIYSLESLYAYSREVRMAGIASAPIHIKLDTGMHRLGFQPSDIEALIEALKYEKSLKIASIFSHFAASEDESQDDFTRMQIERFEAMSSAIIDELKLENTVRSICNSAGVERFSDAHLEMVRLGICLYQNISELKTRITQVKSISRGETIGYNRRTVAENDMKIAIIPIGYADGLDRRLGVRAGQVAIRGELCDIVGNVCMDTTIVDVTHLDNVESGDVATIFGPKGGVSGALTAQDIANRLSTIDYEILTNVSPRIKHIYIND